MGSNFRKATHDGTLEIGDMKIPCAVLEDGTRVLSETGFTNALLGTRSGASKRLKKAQSGGGAPMPLFLAPGNLKPFISRDLLEGPLQPIRYIPKTGNRPVSGYDANLLPAVCEVWLEARDAGDLQTQQLDKAKKADILMRGLAHVGIVALVDEATGYQEVRARKALEEILEKFIREEFRKWAKTFPDEFYKEMFRLKGWPYHPWAVARPSVVGKYTNDLVYERVAPGVLEELQRKNPPDDRGRRKVRHHQWLTEDVGDPRLREHLSAVIALMKASSTWDQFMRAMNRALPRYGKTIELVLND
jgi:hypothetical protein